MNRKILFGIVLVLAAGVLWGSMGTAVQYLLHLDDRFTPLGLVTLRQLSAGILLLGVASLFLPKKIWGVFKDRQCFIGITVNGLLIFLAHYTFFEAISYSNAGTAAILLCTEPLFVGFYQALRQKRMVSVVECFCFLLASTGVILIITDGDFSQLQFSPMALVWGLASAVVAAAYAIQPGPIIRRVGVVPVVAWSMFIGGVIAGFLCPPWTVSTEVWTWESFSAFSYVVVFGTVIAFWAFLSGLKYVTPMMAGLLNCMEPLSAFLFSIMLLGDRLAFLQVVGVGLVLANVVLLTVAKTKH